ncbi:TetR/AcrR family transcriptional regulator [Actinomyces bowdenii]|uniref:TetR family transcriptional regulator C-terminal domain-containing protein n=1 Tax=Actinomyces bowdenii TaxID=131109 RepID=A0A853ENR3_9ACTO|nr:TetR family transcriptional regulator [Actinomyces bowdenii]MBF0697618.1 TetR family transcriptional regulator C-terminal domain-containing protein [Actinomyces bowdenii]NYS69791.1 TetR family transcriptional regulator C-terminal domain-containing protein [Actinomyces bowdenii]
MPKKVDHEQRRKDLAAALRRVVSRGGVESASVRAVAAEAGWSLGAVQYYFSTRDELLLFAGRQLMADADARISEILQDAEAALARDSSAFDLARRLCEETLPIDERHRSEQLLWLALMLRSARQAAPQPAVSTSWEVVRGAARMAVAAVLRRGDWLEAAREGASLPGDAEAVAAELHIDLDGLFLQGLIYPDRTPEVLRNDVTAVLRRLRGCGPSVRHGR